jgi:GTP-binding protein
MFVDQIRIYGKAGDGGAGCVSFRREKFVPKGGPDGGDGGRGGDVVLEVDPNVDNLTAFYYEPMIRGKRGSNGQGKNMYGRAAKPSVYKVPPGTIIYRIPQEEWPSRSGSDSLECVGGGAWMVDFEKEAPEKKPGRRMPRDFSGYEVVADLQEPGEQVVLCEGGSGGKGNVHFKSSKNRVPRESTPGGDGEEGYFYLELRKIADAGLVGFPNAGKSTLLGAISAAHPKIAPYPFTTLHPMVGVVEFSDYGRLTVADIPGLIEGAHRNVGLGHDFLRHVVRCRVLLHVVDIAGSEGRTPEADLAALREELKLYDPLLATRPWLVIANKMDLEGASENLKRFKRKFRKVEVIPISAASREGIDALRERLREFGGA